MTAITCPIATVSPAFKTLHLASRSPAHGAMIAVSIFIAVMIASVSPADTTAPGATLTSSTVPAIGDSTPWCPSCTDNCGTAGSLAIRFALPPPSAAAC